MTDQTAWTQLAFDFMLTDALVVETFDTTPNPQAAERIKAFLEEYELSPVERIVWRDAQTFYAVTALVDYQPERRGWVLEGWNIKRREDGTLLSILKASKGRRRLVAFVEAPTFWKMFEEIRYLSRIEGFQWKPDKYAKF